MSTVLSSPAEEAILSAFLIGGRRSAEALTRVASSLPPEAFRSRADQLLYEAAGRLQRLGTPVDLITLEAELRRTGRFEDAGGFERLAYLVDLVPQADNVEGHAKLVLEDAQRRRWRELLEASLHDLAERDAPSLADLIAGHAERVEQLRASSGRSTRTILLADVLATPELLEPPVALIPRLAWKARTSLLAAREKLGKSTFCAAAGAALSAGHRFLGQDVEAGTVLWVGLEEHVGDAARRFRSFGADGQRVHILERVANPMADLEQAVAETNPDVVFVDTLAALTEALDLDPGSSTAWTPIMGRLAHVARDHQVAVVIVHHGNKTDGSYRDSTAIGAGVDAILEMREGQVAGVRNLKARARWAIEDYSVRIVDATDQTPAFFELAEAELAVDAQVLAFISHHPGSSTRQVRQQVRGKTQETMDAIHRLLSTRAIEDRGGPRGMSLFVTAENPHGTATEPVGNRSGTGSPDHGGEVVPTGGPPYIVGGPPGTAPEPLAGDR